MRNANYFAVGPVRDLGNHFERAMQQLGGNKLGPAHGFVLVTGSGRYQRLPIDTDRTTAEMQAQRTGSRLGQAVTLVGDDDIGHQVVYRDVMVKATKPSDPPRSPSGFLRIVNRIARALRGTARSAEASAVHQALDRLDADWPRLSATDLQRIVSAANQELAEVPSAIMPTITARLDLEAGRVVHATKAAVKHEYGLRITADLTRTDARVARYVATAPSNFIRDEYGRRQAAFSQQARTIVAAGVAEGLGRDEISAQLHAAFTGTATNRSAHYWDVVAAAFVGRARSFAEVTSYAEAGIQYYIIEAVLDEVTTDVCRYLHSKRFRVGAAVAQFQRLERLRDPTRIKHTQPWLRVRQDSRGRRVIVVPTASGDVRAAIVADSAERRGAKDDLGSFRAGLSAAKLETVDVGPPPYHGLCRTTTVPEV